MLECAFKPRADPATVQRIPQIGATIESSGKTNTKQIAGAYPSNDCLATCARKTNVSRISIERAMAKNRNH
jgi:hypothetical protein